MKTIQYITFIFTFIFLSQYGISQIDTSCVGAQGNIVWYIYDDIPGNDLEDLYVDPSYPLSPSYALDMLSLESTYSFSNNYGSILRGFIKIPMSGDYTFNVTGNDRATFYLSSDTDPANMTRIAYSPWAVGKDQHYESPVQTSESQGLEQGTYHYFELHHKENMYSDHATVYWRTPFFADTIWRVINASYLYEYTCISTCPPQGTPCDDGKASTINDVEDGFCNCIGEINPSNNCIGPRGDALAMYFLNISGSNLNDLYSAPNYPLSPDTAIEMSKMKMPYQFGDDYGTLVKGYIKVPVTGDYTFNITGDDQVRLYLSTNDEPANINLISEINGWTGVTEHYKYASQTSGIINLNKNNFYYYELHHKEGWGGDHSNIYWKTPFRPDTNWMSLEGLFIYGYDCELACVPQGTACNDHNPNTENDAYDASCDCVGTPCGGPCDEVDVYETTAFCSPSETYSNNPMDSWLSCSETSNPNSTHGNSHWIMYDFGESLKIERNRYWNYNVENETGKGVKTVIIDYSDNQTSWTNLGTFQWDEATGMNGYAGDSILELNGIITQYLLFTITESWNSPTCAGFSEILFDVRHCLSGGTLCDDGDPNTYNDMYDNNCNCLGLPLIIDNPCDTPILHVTQPDIQSDNYNASNKVVGTGKIKQGNIVTFTAANSIEMNAQFEVKLGALFLASIAPCVDPLESLPIKPVSSIIKLPDPTSQSRKKESLEVVQHDGTGVDIIIKMNKKSELSLYLEDSKGNKIFDFFNNREMQAGSYKKRLPTSNLQPDVYRIILQTKHSQLRQRVVVLADEVVD